MTLIYARRRGNCRGEGGGLSTNGKAGMCTYYRVCVCVCVCVWGFGVSILVRRIRVVAQLCVELREAGTAGACPGGSLSDDWTGGD